MRKVNKLVNCIDQQEMFTRGVKQIIAEKAIHPTDYKDYEYRSIARRAQLAAHAGRRKSIIQEFLGI